MTFETAARALAVVLGVVGVLDPAWQTRVSVPRPVELQIAPGDDAATVREQLERALEGEATFAADAPAVARVIIGDAVPRTIDGISTSFVSLAASAPNTRIVSVDGPPLALPGWRTAVAAVVEGLGVAGATSTVLLEHSGVEVGRAEHKWSRADERATVTIPFVPPAEGAARLTLRTLPLDGETSDKDNIADVRSIARARRLRVLAHEVRPSWAAVFVRRVLEANPAFDVSASAGASKGLTVSAGAALGRLRQLDDYEVVVLGAPEELSGADVDALEAFARRRGGAVVLLPDRRPSGPYLRLLHARQFEEVLSERPLAAQGQDGAVRASELALPRGDVPARDVLASIDRNGRREAAVFGTPLGDGRVVFSGAMDAWRFRAEDEAAFARFWTSTVAGLALAAPPRLDVTVEPAVVQPGDVVRVRVRLRRSELRESGGRVDVPAVEARSIAASGSQEVIRLWPGAAPGTFEGRVQIAEPGRFDISASSGATTADTIVIAADGARSPDDSGDLRAVIASTSGGVQVSSRDLTPLVQSLRALAAPEIARDVHPARSVWFVAAFAALVCGEWAMRRRAGLR